MFPGAELWFACYEQDQQGVYNLILILLHPSPCSRLRSSFLPLPSLQLFSSQQAQQLLQYFLLALQLCLHQ